MARPRKPNAVKELQGTMQECRRNKNAPKVPILSTLPPPMIPLSPRALEHRERVAALLLNYKIITELDLDALDMYAQSFDMYLEVLEEIKKTAKKNRFVAVSERGKIKNPIFNIQNVLFSQLHACQIKLGLTPADRMRLNAENGENKEENPYTAMQALTEEAEKPQYN